MKSTKDADRLAEHFIKQRHEVFADSIKKLLAHLDTGNQRYYNKMCAMLSLFTEFITEFESSWAIKQLFAEGKGKIDK